jgi:hypothetical protein
MRILAMAAALLVATGGQAQTGPQQAEIIKDDPPAQPQRLELVDLPKATGPARDLFNGRDLAGWAPWLGYADTSLTFKPQTVAPLGTSIDTREVFAVETVDGGPAIRAGGRYWGSLATTEDFADYHLSLEYRWGGLREGESRNNGVVYFSHGSPGAVFGTWMTGMEFQLEHGSNGMAIPMGNSVRTHVTIAQDKGVRYPYRVFRMGGREIDLANGNPAYSVEHASDAERPVGRWNRIDLYVVGDHAVQVVNGVPVMELRDVAEVDAAGNRVKLTHGRIQLQSEGAVTWFRNIRIEPITALPRIREGRRR